MKEIQNLPFEMVYDKLEKGELTPFNFYNIDLSPDQVFTVEHYITHTNDNIEKSQKLKKVFYDIEVFLNHKQGTSISDMIMRGENLVNAISHYYSSENKFYCYFVPPENCFITEKEFEAYLLEESTKNIKIGTNDDGTDKLGKYFDDGQTVEVKLFKNGIDLVIAFWDKIKKDDPAIYSGWNSDNFDTPYLYHYLLTYFNGDHAKVASIMSNFGEVDIDNGRDRAGNQVHRIRIADYINLDLMYCYRDRADGGLGLGKKVQSYSLNNIAKIEVGFTKYEYKLEGLTLDLFYERDPLNFLLYNLWDTALAYKIDAKTGMTDLYNMQRRKMHTAMGPALRGSSPLFDTYIYGNLKEHEKFIRWGISSESSFEVTNKEIKKIPKVKTLKKIKWNIEEIGRRDCSKIINRFPGAYVKKPIPGFYNTGTISDLDASRLYPSMIYIIIIINRNKF